MLFTVKVFLTGYPLPTDSLADGRHMCRYNSGFFFRHPLMMKYAWYWRVEPDIDFYCSVNYDPFTFMRENDKVYSFVISMPEYITTIPTLWEKTKQYCRENPFVVAKDNALDFLVDDGRGWDGEYNLCHFWSNFEIASLDFWRGDTYLKYFEYLDKSGGFYYERWGDAPVYVPTFTSLISRYTVLLQRCFYRRRRSIGLGIWDIDIILGHIVPPTI